MIGWMLSLAFAADGACQACCRAVNGAVCASEIAVMGDQAQITRDVGGYAIRGAWMVNCDGRTSYDSSRYFVVDHAPRPGEVLSQGVAPAQLHCYKQACSLPDGVCLSAPDNYGSVSLIDCRSRTPVDIAFVSPGKARKVGDVVVLLDGKPLVVERIGGASVASAAAVPVPAVAAAKVAPASAAYAPTAPPGSAWAPTGSAPVTSAFAPTAVASTTTSPPAADAAITTALASIPADPPVECRPPSEAIRSEARRRADSGDEKRMRREHAAAINEYRAALAMDPCNGYGWLGLGETAASAGRPDVAVRALKNATRLMAGHYGAWTTLGQQYEILGQYRSAAEAFHKAVELRPDHVAALAGLDRVIGK